MFKVTLRNSPTHSRAFVRFYRTPHPPPHTHTAPSAIATAVHVPRLVWNFGYAKLCINYFMFTVMLVHNVIPQGSCHVTSSPTVQFHVSAPIFSGIQYVFHFIW